MGERITIIMVFFFFFQKKLGSCDWTAKEDFPHKSWFDRKLCKWAWAFAHPTNPFIVQLA